MHLSLTTSQLRRERNSCALRQARTEPSVACLKPRRSSGSCYYAESEIGDGVAGSRDGGAAGMADSERNWAGLSGCCGGEEACDGDLEAHAWSLVWLE